MDNIASYASLMDNISYIDFLVSCASLVDICIYNC